MFKVTDFKYQPLVSVVIPTYNMSKYIAESVNSVLTQTYRHLDVIVIDDGSDDNTKLAVEPLLSDSRLTYHYQDNSGAPSARNKGVSLARGEFVAFNDADDIWKPEKLQKQVKLFQHDTATGVVYSDRLWIDGDGCEIESPPKYRYRGSAAYRTLIIENVVPMSSAVVRRSLLSQVGGFDERFPCGDDWDIWLRLSTHTSFDYVADALVLHRKWPQQMTRSKLPFAQANFDIYRKWIDSNPGILSRRELLHGWAARHARYSRALFRVGRKPEAFKAAFRALWCFPTNHMSWKHLVKMFLGYC